MMLEAFLGLSGVLVGSALAMWGQKRGRDARMRNTIRLAYGDWIKAHLALHRAEQRVVDLMRSEKEVASLRLGFREAARNDEELRARQAEYDRTVESLARELGVSHRDSDRAALDTDAAYARVMLCDHSGKRIAIMTRIQEAPSPYVIAAKAGRAAAQVPSGALASDRIDEAIFYQAWRERAIERGKLARYVEATLRMEGTLPFLVTLQQSDGRLPAASVLEQWEQMPTRTRAQKK